MTLLGWLVLLVGLVRADWAPSPRQEQAYNDGVIALSNGTPAQAEALFRQVLEASPDCGLAQHGLGVALLRQNRTSEAASVMRSLAEGYPQQAEALTGLSVAAFAAQDFDTARMAGLTAVSLDPASLEAVTALVSVLLRLGELDSARQVVADARGTVSGPSLACLEAQVFLEGGQEAEARSRLSYCQQSPYPELSGAVLSRLGGAAARGRTTAQVADAVGADRVVQLSRAVERYNMGDPAGAVALLDPLIAADGRRADARLLRARARYALGDRAGAREDLTAAFQDGGGTWVDVHRSGAMSGVLLQSHAQALDRALADGAALSVQIALESRDLDEARATLDEARAALGDAPALQVAEARLLYATGDTTRAWGVALQAAAVGETAALDLLGEWGLAAPAAFPEEAARPLATSSRWSDRYNLALVRSRQRQHSACVTLVREARTTTLDPAHHQQLWTLGHRCAVAAADLPHADEFYALLRGARVGDTERFNHALLRYQRNNPTGTLELLRGSSPPADPAARAQYAALMARAHGDLQQWHEAVGAVAAAPAQEQYWLGTRLAENGQLTDARRLLGGACEDLDSETRARCSQLLLRLGGPL